MTRTINQSNLYLLLPSKICWMANMLSEEKGISITEAIKEIYSSNTYKRLEIEKTKLWHWGLWLFWRPWKNRFLYPSQTNRIQRIDFFFSANLYPFGLFSVFLKPKS